MQGRSFSVSLLTVWEFERTEDVSVVSVGSSAGHCSPGYRDANAIREFDQLWRQLEDFEKRTESAFDPIFEF